MSLHAREGAVDWGLTCSVSCPMRTCSFIEMTSSAAVWFAVAASAIAAPPGEKGKPAAEKKPKPKITINKGTTYITEPLRPDGYPDYVAALNQRMSQSVTPEN